MLFVRKVGADVKDLTLAEYKWIMIPFKVGNSSEVNWCLNKMCTILTKNELWIRLP